MQHLLDALRDHRILWLLVLVPVPVILHGMYPDAHTTTFVLSIMGLVPLAALLSLATEQVAERTGDTIGGLLNATLGNLTELIIALAALKAGEYLLVKASIAGAIVANTLFMTGTSFLLGGLKHHVQQFNASNIRMQMALLFLASFALMVPSMLAAADMQAVPPSLSLAISLILLFVYALSMIFTLGTHRKYFAAAMQAPDHGHAWPVMLAIVVLLAATLAVALVSEVFVASLTGATADFGLTPAFVGFIVVAIVGAAAEMATAFSAARKNRLDLSVGISFGSSVQIALFVAPALVLLSYLVGPQPMALSFWPGAIVMIFVATFAASFVAAAGTAAWFLGVLMLAIYAIFGVTLYILPPAA